MTALHCPATLLLAPHAADPGQAAALLAGALPRARVARVYVGPDPAARRTAESVAAGLGVAAEVREDLRDLQPGEDWPALLARMAAGLGAIADQHPGETVLVLGPEGPLAYAVPRLAGNLPGDWAGEHPLAPDAVVEAAVDADGWQVRSWPEPDPMSETGNMRDST